MTTLHDILDTYDRAEVLGRERCVAALQAYIDERVREATTKGRIKECEYWRVFGTDEGSLLYQALSNRLAQLTEGDKT